MDNNLEDEDIIYKEYFDNKDALIESTEPALDIMDTAEEFDNLYSIYW